ncbi:MAG: DUF116 domain-containing protein [Endomicrobium sp.]|jgi:hypothetical protein|nr:DUF116 domain-containing protein [Endomicrobium sp.]
MRLCSFSQKNKEHAYKTFTNKQNRLQEEKFASIPFNNRLVFVPHCIRNTKLCAAEEKEGYYTCSECRGCKINEISRLAKELNYKTLYVLKGGRAIEKIIKEQKPKAVIGVACFFEGYQAFNILKDKNVAVQFTSLKKDGCANTDVDIEEVEKALRRRI